MLELPIQGKAPLLPVVAQQRGYGVHLAERGTGRHLVTGGVGNKIAGETGLGEARLTALRLSLSSLSVHLGTDYEGVGSGSTCSR